MTQAQAALSNGQEIEGDSLSRVSRLKGGGYLVSTVSVVLLAVPGIKAAMDTPLLFVSALGGAATSIGGMNLRWRSHCSQQKQKGD